MILKSLSLRPSSYTSYLLHGLSTCLFPTGETLHEFLSHVQCYIDSCPGQRVEKIIDLRLDSKGTEARLSVGTVISVFSGSFSEVKVAGA
jgi:hypothetical protein